MMIEYEYKGAIGRRNVARVRFEQLPKARRDYCWSGSRS